MIDLMLHVDTAPAKIATGVWNVQNPKIFHWSRDLLPLLHNAGLAFQPVSTNLWLQRLRAYSESVPTDVALRENPAVKLLDYFEKTYYGGASPPAEVGFETAGAEDVSVHLRNAPDVLRDGLLAKILEVWLRKWGC